MIIVIAVFLIQFGFVSREPQKIDMEKFGGLINETVTVTGKLSPLLSSTKAATANGDREIGSFCLEDGSAVLAVKVWAASIQDLLAMIDGNPSKCKITGTIKMFEQKLYLQVSFRSESSSCT